MNEIIKQRIEETAYKESSMYDTIQEKNAAYSTGMKIATFALQNQWISVGEALPEEVQEGCCDDKFVLYCGEYPATASYDHKMKKWYYGDYEILGVTHWMPIPSLEGGEK